MAINWAESQPQIQLLALAGSHARGAAQADSDIDLVILADRPEDYLNETGWTETFGRVKTFQFEDWGKVTSLRAWYEDGMEVEFGFGKPDWAVDAEDVGTCKVIQDGIWILFSRSQTIVGQIERLRRTAEDTA